MIVVVKGSVVCVCRLPPRLFLEGYGDTYESGVLEACFDFGG